MWFRAITIWIIIKGFAKLWFAGIAILTAVSCIKHGGLIMATLSGNMWAWINALMPIVIMIGAIIYMIKSALS